MHAEYIDKCIFMHICTGIKVCRILFICTFLCRVYIEREREKTDKKIFFP